MTRFGRNRKLVAAGVLVALVAAGTAPVVVPAVLAISGEYDSGLIRTTLTATPHRTTVLAAKSLALTGVVAAAGTVAVLGSLLVSRLTPSGRGRRGG
ncbi:hypothetical protein ACWEGE_38555 [Amycolatopsis sp. NPDC004747]